MVRFEKEKFKKILHYIISNCENIENIGKTVLFKILYFSDFDYYELNEKPITGEVYARLVRGPAPRHFSEAIGELKEESKIKGVRVDYMGHTQIKFLSLKDPEISGLSADEIKLVDNTIKKLSSMNATQVSAYSHGDMPWKSAKDGENLDYEMVFYRDDTYTVREYNEVQ